MASDLPTQLYLVVVVTADARAHRGLAELLSHVLAQPRAKGLVSAILLVPADGTALDARIAPLVEAVQRRSVAALVAADARLARTLRADGVHLPPGDEPLAAFEEARDILGTRFIVGADAGRSRHDAMSLGEAGADYIGFGVARDGDEEARAHRLELVQWWSEIFEVPCVAFDAASPAEAAALAAAGAEFVAIRLPADLAPGDAARWLDGYAEAIVPLRAPLAATH